MGQRARRMCAAFAYFECCMSGLMGPGSMKHSMDPHWGKYVHYIFKDKVVDDPIAHLIGSVAISMWGSPLARGKKLVSH